MRSPNRFRALLTLLIVLAVALTACGDDDDDDAAAGGGETPAATTTVASDDGEAGGDGDGSAVRIAAFRFTSPAPVAPGATVPVVNTDSVPHTMTADDGAFDSGQIDADGEASVTAPSEPGTYAYHCEIHSSMKGELVVS